MSHPYTSPISAQAVQCSAVTLTDYSGQGLIDIRGRNLGGIFQAIRIGEIKDVVGEPFYPSPQPLSHKGRRAKIQGRTEFANTLIKPIDYGVLARLTPEQFILLGNANVNDTSRWLRTGAGDARVTITDVTHGYGHMRLAGEQARAVLPKICGLDFADSTFPNQHAAQSSLAKVRTLIIRLDDANSPAYHLIVSTSLADYVWGVVADAAQEFSY